MSGASAASAYFNPALLPAADAGVESGFFLLYDAIDLTLDARSSAVDVPLSALDNFNTGDRSVGTQSPEPTTWINDGCTPDPDTGGCVSDLPARPRQGDGSSGKAQPYLVLGFVHHLYKRYLTLGAYTLVPLGSYVHGHTFFPDEREQHFTNSLHPELYSDRLTSLSLSTGAGSQVTDWLALGLGMSLSLSTDGTANSFIADSSRLNQTVQLSTEVDVDVGAAPYAGVALTPLPALTLALTAHMPQEMRTDATIMTLLANGDRQVVERAGVQAWQPWIFGLGAAYDFEKLDAHRFGVVASATYELWSDYVNRQGERPLRNYEWSDTFTLAAGGRYVYAGKLRANLDGNYHPTPVPPQSGRTNYVDNDRFGIEGGVSYDFPIDDSGKTRLRLGGQAQVHILRPRHQNKFDPKGPTLSGASYSQIVLDEWADAAIDSRGDPIPEAAGLQTNNPGWPGFASSGFLFGAGVSASLLY